MNDCAVLDSLSGEAFLECEGFEEWTTYDSGQRHEARRQSSCFDDWTCFHGSANKNEETAHLSHQLPLEARSSGQEHKVDNSHMINPCFVFHECFRDQETMKDAVTMEISPLSQLVHGSAHMPPLSSLCHQMLCEPEVLRLSCPKPNLHSQEQLISTLQLKHNLQTTSYPDLGFEEPESSPGGLIQTKLVAPMQCRNGPGFFYQISRQWLTQHTVRLLPHQDKKGLLQ